MFSLASKVRKNKEHSYPGSVGNVCHAEFEFMDFSFKNLLSWAWLMSAEIYCMVLVLAGRQSKAPYLVLYPYQCTGSREHSM